MRTAIAADEAVVQIPLEKLLPHPKNTHGDLAATHPRILELKASISKIQQSEPCLVRRPSIAGMHEILSGHLRVQAQRLLGVATVPCIVKDVDDEEALAILITSNEKEPVDPLLEAEAIQDLLEKTGGDLRKVAERLGKTVRYVAGRANLRTLSKKIRALFANGKIAHWTVDMLEEVARLRPEAQDELAANRPQNYPLEQINDFNHLSRVLGDCFRELGNAMWKLDDAGLEPTAGPCTTCPKTSLRAPGLFDEGDLDPEDPKSIKKAVCRDTACWDRKKAAHVERRMDELKSANPDAAIVKRSYRQDAIPKGVKAVESYDAHDAKKGEKGAKAAILLTDQGPKLGYVKIDRGASSPAARSVKKEKPAAEKDPKKRLAESKEAIGRRRRGFVVDAIREKILKTSGKDLPAENAPGLVVAYGVEVYERMHAAPKKRKALFDEQVGGTQCCFAEAVWPRIREHVAETLKRHNAANLDDEHAAAVWVAQLVGIEVEPIVAAAVKEIPDPKWWSAHDAVPTKKAKK